MNRRSDGRRLVWGCTHSPPAGWTHLRPQAIPGPQAACDILIDGLPYPRDSLCCIACPQGLQHLEIHEVLRALRELHRALEPGGVLRVCVPDLDAAIAAYTGGRSDFLWTWDWHTFSGNFATQLTNYGYTRSLFTFEHLRELLYEAGFIDITRLSYGVTAGRHPEIVEPDSRPLDSLFVEACKPATTAGRPGPRPAEQIHLSWAEDPATSLTVTWHTAGHGRHQLDYRRAGTADWARHAATTRPSPGVGVLHSVTVRGLSPGTAYEYRVSGDHGGWPILSETFPTRTAPGRGSDFTFAFVCDTGLVGRPDGNATGTQQVIEEIAADRPSLVLGGGDYAYANRDGRFADVADAVDRWFEQMQPLMARVPFMAQYGNHEIFLQERFRDWAPRFRHPPGFDGGRNYSFDVGDAHFTAFFAPDPHPTADQLAWLDNDLASARQRRLPWLIVYQHEPIYSHGHSHPASPELRKFLAPILEKHGVALHLSGHDQSYERTHALSNARTTPRTAVASAGRYSAGSGVVYAKVSPGGKLSEARNDFSRFSCDEQDFIAARDDSSHHYALVKVKASREVAVQVFGVRGDRAPKTLVDSFRIGAPQRSRRG